MAPVGGKPEPLKAPGEPSQEEEDQWFQEYRNTNPDIDEALEYAGSVMGEELAPAFNELIESDDEEARVGALGPFNIFGKSQQLHFS